MVECEEFVDWWTGRAQKNRESSNIVTLKLKQLVKKSIKIYNVDIFSCVWNNQIEVFKEFIASDPRYLLSTDTSQHAENWTCLHYAAYRGHAELVDFILSQTNSSTLVNKSNDCGFTPLFYACQQGHIVICEMLLEKGADPTICGSDQNYPAYMLCPASFGQDNSDINYLLSTHSKCKPPTQIPIQNIVCRMSTLNLLSIVLPNQKLYSTLPISNFHVLLSISGDSSSSLSIIIKAKSPTVLQSYDCLIDKKFVTSVFKKMISIDKYDLLIMELAPVNAMGIEGPRISVQIDISKAIDEFRDEISRNQGKTSSPVNSTISNISRK